MVGLEYLAGFFDGEGCVSVARNSGNGYTLTVQLGQNQEGTMTTTTELDLVGELLTRDVLLEDARKTAAWTLLAFNVLDLILTYWVLHLGGVEGNPLAVWLIETKLAIFAKLGLCGLAVWSAYYLKHKTTLFSVCAGWFVAGIYGMVVLFNIATLIGKLKGM